MKLAIMGAPGAGKGTQAFFVSSHFNIAHISTGDLLREHMKNGTKIGMEITDLMNKGRLVSDEIVIKVLKERILHKDCYNGFLLDGFPRTRSQAEISSSIVGEIDRIISVDVPDEIIVTRMDGRRICTNCGSTYHLTYKPPKSEVCDNCKSVLTQRDDDKAKTVLERLEIYHNQAEPIKDYFRQTNRLIEIDGTGEIDFITKSIIENIQIGMK